MTGKLYTQALTAATEFLQLYSPNKPSRLAFASVPESDAERKLNEALQEAQVVLQETSKRAFEARIANLKTLENRQLAVNGVHLLTGSAFVLLIANKFPGPMKWIGAVFSFVAGLIALFLPRNLAELERQVSEDVATLSSLSGDIAKIQAQLLYSHLGEDPALAERITVVIGECARLSKKYELDQIAIRVGYLPRGDSTLAPQNTSSH